MIKVMFICLGNICRSPMAELVFKDMVERKGLSDLIQVASSGTNNFHEGSPVHPGTKRKLRSVGIYSDDKRSQQYRKENYQEYDYLVCMDKNNVKDAKRISGGDPDHKIRLLLEYAKENRDIKDPWYTDDFEVTYKDVVKGCEGLLEHILAKLNE